MLDLKRVTPSNNTQGKLIDQTSNSTASNGDLDERKKTKSVTPQNQEKFSDKFSKFANKFFGHDQEKKTNQDGTESKSQSFMDIANDTPLNKQQSIAPHQFKDLPELPSKALSSMNISDDTNVPKIVEHSTSNGNVSGNKANQSIYPVIDSAGPYAYLNVDPHSNNTYDDCGVKLGSKHAKSMPKIATLFKKPIRISDNDSSINLTANSVTASSSQEPIQVAPKPSSIAVSSQFATNTLLKHGTKDDRYLQPTKLQAKTLGTRGKSIIGMSAHEIGLQNVLQREVCLDDFYIIRRVGKGGFANVFLVRSKGGRYFALKAIRKSDVVRMKQEKQILNEKRILLNIRHPFVVELFHAFQNTSYLFMTMEFVAGGDLFSYLRRMHKFPENDARFYVSEVLVTLQYLHSQKIVYRDLKPENILLDATGHTKLADFGFAKVVNNTTASFCGTPDYIAVEIVGNKPYTKAVDWWSLGVLIFELLSGKTPFGDENTNMIYENIQAGRIKWNNDVRPAKDLIKLLLNSDPSLRLGSSPFDGEEIRNQSWFAPVDWKRVESRTTAPPFVPGHDCAPEVIDRDRMNKVSRSEEYMEILKAGGSGKEGFVDPFGDMFKDF